MFGIPKVASFVGLDGEKQARMRRLFFGLAKLDWIYKRDPGISLEYFSGLLFKY